MIKRLGVLAGVVLLTAAAPPPVTPAEKAEARAIIRQMIAIKTAKGEGQVPVLAEALAVRFRAAGFAAEDIVMLPAVIDGEKTVGLLVRYRGKSAARKPIALLAHMDVVGALAENWATDPWQPIEKDGYLYGRGSSDNKAGMTLLATSFLRLKRAGWVPDRDVVLAFSGDEETGMRTTRLLAAHAWVKDAEFALNSDAGGGQMERDGSNPRFAIQSAEKTVATYQIAAANSGGHSSVPRPDNAIFDIADAIKAVQAVRFPVEFNEITRAMVADRVAARSDELGGALKALLANPADAAARAIAEKHPSDANILWTTCVPTMLKAGNAPNALPQNAVLTVNCRIFPGTSVAAVQAVLTKAIGNAAIKVTLDGDTVESPVSPVNARLFDSLTRAVHVNYTGAPVKPNMSSGGTDGRVWRRAGVPTYGAGSLAMVHPDDGRAHGTDERVRLDSFDKELLYWDVLLRDVAGPVRP
ncbi:peptidase M20 [Polymorphobacter glacialis]|uniref:Peptidase M20 n=2 Tax=Sandarakinorhabdus glacialis TaxID=1614636 RepID=A0A917E8V9_9SPHN|nr:peptidase M20 [Polymorphobacter glacialis]